MALDDNGILDPNNWEDMERIKARAAERQEQAQIDQYLNTANQAKLESKQIGEMLQNELKRRGVSQQKYQEGWQKDPRVKDRFARRVSDFADDIADFLGEPAEGQPQPTGRARDAEGRFVSTRQPQPQGQQQPQSQKGGMDVHREKVKSQGYLDEGDELDMRSDFFGDDLLAD